RPPDATNYPTVTELEKKLFTKSYESEDITRRLARLEQAAFNRTYPDLPMVDRVDQLTLKIDPNNPLSIEEQVNPTAGLPRSTTSLPSQGRDFTGNSMAIYAQLKSLEERVVGKSFGGELIINRLDRLERILYGAPQHGSVNERISRLTHTNPNNTAHLYGPSGYETGPTGQPQVGAPQYVQPSTSAQAPPYHQPNLQPQSRMPSWGSYNPGYGSTQEGQQFSSDMQQMLPPHVRQQLGGQDGLQSATGRQFPITGMGQASVAGVTGDAAAAAAPPSHTVPSTPTRPLTQPDKRIEYVQRIAMLEVKVFGHRYDNLTMQDRLSQLEQQVYGRTYPYFTIDRRIDRILNKLPMTRG
ncbi:MAG: hypothetical protein KC476_11745, partial [Cyanobacteria bacterium HKST-UBA06]|nr:hypothetical protein [Cyanobacteria bacterium HKST-UBA06]